MGLIEISLIGLGLSMDAFAVSICKGLSMNKLNKKNALIIALYFGIFQAIMPLIGYTLGSSFYGVLEAIDHWIAFLLLASIGGNMIKESIFPSETAINANTNFKTMLLLAVATSIDALAIGIAFALLDINIFASITIIGIITFIISFLGVKIGNKFGDKFSGKAELIGGIILILIGLKILLEHLGVI